MPRTPSHPMPHPAAQTAGLSKAFSPGAAPVAPALPDDIVRFLHAHHVVSLATRHDSDLWCASCFYALDEARVGLVVLSSRRTRHGELMRQNPQVAGTIAGQPEDVRAIQGIQFAGHAECLGVSGDSRLMSAALDCYLARHPVARGMTSDVWLIWLEEIKLTDNTVTFGHKLVWRRG